MTWGLLLANIEERFLATRAGAQKPGAGKCRRTPLEMTSLVVRLSFRYWLFQAEYHSIWHA
jgi:hypothetical protein